MQLVERKLNRSWAIVTALLCAACMLFCGYNLWLLIEQGRVFLFALNHYISLFSCCFSILIFGIMGIAFSRQKVNGLLVASLWAYGVKIVVFDVVWCVVTRQFSWEATDLLGAVIPLALLIGCCAKEEGARPEKGAKLVVTILLAASILEAVSCCLKFNPQIWSENISTIITTAVGYLLPGVLFYGAFRAIETPKEEQDEPDMKG